MQELVFRARPPQQTLFLMFLGLDGLFGLGMHFFVEPKSTLSVALDGIQAISLLPFAAFLLWKPRLAVDATDLHIRIGGGSTRIPLGSIRGVRRTNWKWGRWFWWSTGLEIKHGRWDELHVYPRDRESFIAALLERNPAITAQ